MHGTEQGIALTAVVGFAMQWVRGHKAIPNWVSYAGIVTLCGVGYLLVRGEDLKECHDWLSCGRVVAFGLLMFVQQARGSGAMAKDAGIAPASNTR